MGAKKPVTITSDPDEIKIVKLKKDSAEKPESDAKSAKKAAKEEAKSKTVKKSKAETVKKDKAETTKDSKTETAKNSKAETAKDSKKTKKEDQTAGEAEQQAKPTKAKTKKIRSKKYQAVRSKIDRTKAYDPFAAIELVKKLSYSKFTGTITAHLTVKETGLSKDVTLPHSTGQTKTVEIVSEETIKKIEAGEIDFDILLSTPQFMAKLTKYAPILGPKGLMPNPKNGTLTPNPEEKAKELAAGTMTVRTEKKAPLIHVVIGKTDMETKELTENLQVLMKAFKQKLVKVTIAASMSPGVKVEIGDVVA